MATCFPSHSLTIPVSGTKYARHCCWCDAELVREVILLTSTDEHFSVGPQAMRYINSLWTLGAVLRTYQWKWTIDGRRNPETLPSAQLDNDDSPSIRMALAVNNPWKLICY